MATRNWFSDASGNIHEKFDIRNMQESFFTQVATEPEQDGGTDYPFTIAFGGSGIWREQAAIHMRRCALFAIELITAGNMKFMQDGKGYVAEKGTAYTLRPGTNVELSVGNKGFVHKRYVGIAGPSLDPIREKCGLAQSDCITLSDSGRLARLMKQAVRLLRDKPDDYHYRLSLLAYDIMLLLSRDARDQKYPPQVNAIVHFMGRNLQRGISIDELSKIACLSRAQLHRVCKKHLGQSPLRHFSRMRMRQAAAILRASPQRTISDIARQFAFEDQANFASTFKKIMGESPHAYRSGRP